MGEKAAVLVVDVCGRDFKEMGQEHKQQETDEKQATQGLVRIQSFTGFLPS